MNFIEKILQRLEEEPDRIFQEEVREGELRSASGKQLLELVRSVRLILEEKGIQPGDRCVLIAPNSLRWTAVNLAVMAHGALFVPLYARQAPAELAAMIRDCRPALVFCQDQAMRQSLAGFLDDISNAILLDEAFQSSGAPPAAAGFGRTIRRPGADGVTIIYTSGTSGEAKGVILTVANLDHMLFCTDDRLSTLMRGSGSRPDRVYHYLPCNFAGSWILMLTSLLRGSRLSLCTDLNRITDDLPRISPDYFLNVPVLLERVRKGMEEAVQKRGGLGLAIFRKALTALAREREGRARMGDLLWKVLADQLIFKAVRKKMGGGLRALICGSAPLALETQQFFMGMGIRVLQVYGLTETTAICTMDHPDHVIPGMAGPAIQGTEMKLGPQDEILVRGPHIFSGYWGRPAETAASFLDGWFRTGDQGTVDEGGNWQIIGRIKNLLILSSGHNIAPEPLEESLLKTIPGARQALLVGHGRSFITVLLTGEMEESSVESALAKLNESLPHYRRIRAFRCLPESFTIENGLLTANGKLKRDSILRRWAALVEEMYSASRPPAGARKEAL